MGTTDEEQFGSEDDQSQPEKFKEIVEKWPKSTFLIIGNEFCERFSFYGMRAVLTLYIVNILGFRPSSATVLFHAFTVVTYTSPILGSILADGYIGKFWTIFSVSILYAIGQIILAFSSISPAGSSIHPWLDLIGLLIVGVGTGGIKPCVSAFGGDQFPAHYTKMISIFFSIFYFSINAGSLISMFLTPWMRSLSCLGNESCYPLAFGIPAILMIVATLIFMAGSFSYKKVPPKENVIFRVVGTIARALRRKAASPTKTKNHWLEYSLDGHDCEKSERCKQLHGNCAERKFIEDIKGLIRICVMMIPVPMFWALYDQQGSTWVIQAVAMDAKITSNWTLLPDQMGVLNALLILVFIPVFQSGVYPMVEKFGIKLTMLRKMAAGGVLVALSFFVCGIVQLFVNQSLPLVPQPNEAHLTIINAFPTCEFEVSVNSAEPFDLPPGLGISTDDVVEKPIIFKNGVQIRPNISFESPAPNCPTFSASPTLTAGHAYTLRLTPTGYTYSQIKVEKPSNGQGDLNLSLNLLIKCENLPDAVTWKNCTNETGYQGTIGLCKFDEFTKPDAPCDPRSDDRFYQFGSDQKGILEVFDYQSSSSEDFGIGWDAQSITPGTYRLYYIDYSIPYTKTSKPTASQLKFYPFDLPAFKQSHMGGVYTLTIASRSKIQKEVLATTETIVHYNHVSILWQIPQYVLITAGEVMFSITGLEFAYSEASPQLKSVVQAIWLFTTAVGDLIDVAILALGLFSDVATQMFVFGGAMLIVTGIFILLAIFYYQYADYSSDHSDENGEDSFDMIREQKVL